MEVSTITTLLTNTITIIKRRRHTSLNTNLTTSLTMGTTNISLCSLSSNRPHCSRVKGARIKLLTSIKRFKIMIGTVTTSMR